MKIGFFLPRSPLMKLYAPVIEYLLSKGEEVTIFCDYTLNPKSLGYKRYTYPYVDTIPSFKKQPDISIFRTLSELYQQIKTKEIQAIVLYNFVDRLPGIKKMFGGDIIIIVLQYFGELFKLGEKLVNAGMTHSDVVYTYSDTWLKVWKTQTPALSDQIDKKCVNVGFPELDQLKDFDAETIRKKYNLPDKKVVVLFPFPWRLLSLWSRLLHRFSDYMLTNSILEYVKRNDAILIVKGREKNFIPFYLRKTADKVFFDESFYPFITLELLHIADLSINFYSCTIFESVFTNTPTICIAPKKGYWEKYEGRENDPGSHYNFPGAVYHETIDSLTRDLPHKSFADYPLARRKEFIDKFLGFDDHRASERLYEHLKRVL